MNKPQYGQCNLPSKGLKLQMYAQHVLGRELEAWEIIVVGALSGGIAAVVTTIIPK